MKNNSKIAVIGGTGKSGRFLVQELLHQRIYFKALVRNPQNFEIQSPFVETIYGNVRDYDTVKFLLNGCHTVISTLGMGIPPSEPTIFSTSTHNIVRAMYELKIKRYIVTTGLNVHTPRDKKGAKARNATEWMYENFPKSTHDRQKEYQILADSKLDWTLVRLPLIALSTKRSHIATCLKDCSGDEIIAADLANFLVEQVGQKTFVRQAPFIYSQ